MLDLPGAWEISKKVPGGRTIHFLEATRPKRVSKVGDSHETSLTKSKKHHARTTSGSFSLACVMNLHDFEFIASIPRIPRIQRSGLQLGPHLPHAPGARMTVVKQTPSNYIFMVDSAKSTYLSKVCPSPRSLPISAKPTHLSKVYPSQQSLPISRH